MHSARIPLLPGLLLAGLFTTVLAGQTNAADLVLNKGDHICIVGNTLAERMQHSGWLETRLHARFPEHELVFRNLGYSGDEIDGFRDGSKRLRSMDFGSQDQWLSGSAPCPQPDKLSPRDLDKVRANRFELTNTQADVIFAFYGYNESFAGEQGLPAFKERATAFVTHTLSQKYNGESAPRLVFFSPIAQEHITDPNLPGAELVAATNARLKMYAAVLKEVAEANGAMYVDILSTTEGDREPGKALTINSIHLNEMGDALVAAAIEKGLFPSGPLIKRDGAALERLRKTVNDKNFYWYNRYRVTDGYSTYGDRAFLKFSEGPGGYGDGLSNYSVGQRELDVLDVKTSNRDKVVWATAQGSHNAEPVDNNLPELLQVISNKPGPLEGGLHEYQSGEAAIASMTPLKGTKVELFADEAQFPELANPVQMAFDAKGRLWVAVWPSYPHWKPTDPMNDKLLILEDTNQDGRADVCKTFVDTIHNPTGFEFWNGGVFVAQGPDLLFLKDTDGDDKCDMVERVIHGLDTADTHHTANSFVLDAGGALYFQEGTFHHTQVETPWGAPRRVANGAVFRYEPRTRKFDVHVSFGFANPHGHVVETWGQNFVYDGTGSQPYHALLFSGDVDFPHKHGHPPQLYGQRTRPCSGVEYLSSSHFPEEFRGNLLVHNVIGFLGTLNYKLQAKGSGFSATEVEPLVSSSDPNFRPSDIETAPDGSVYFTDWQNTIIGHMQHNLRDPSRDKQHGRVYRLFYPDRPLVPEVPIAGASVESLLTVLTTHADDRIRHRVRVELSGRDTTEVIAAARTSLAGLDTSAANHALAQLELLWLFQSHNVVNPELLSTVLASTDDRARAAGVRVLTYWRDRVAGPLELLRTAVNDDSGRVRLQAVWALSYFIGADAQTASEIAVESLVYEQDEFLKHTLDETNRTLDRRIAEFRAAGGK